MKRIFLLIKATSYHEAKEAGRSRNVFMNNLCLIGPTNFRALAEVKDLAKIQKWFDEDQKIIKNFGHPIGTLLFFQEQP